MWRSLDPAAIPERLGPYRVASAVGRGGMGTVLRGQDEALGRPVALKVISAELCRDPSFLDRFRREARATAQLSHQNLAHVYAIGEESGRLYFAMEFIEGRSLAELLAAEGALAPERAADLVAQAARGLREARLRGVIHRDVKPSNLMLSREGVVKVTDFGLAKTAQAGDASITAAGTVLGTPHYMSPEQGRGDSVDHRSDIYSLGATFFHLLTGQPPFQADTPMGIVVRHVTDPVPRLRTLRPEVPPPFERVVERMLAKDPASRYQDYDALIPDLKGLAGLRVVDVAAQPLECQHVSPWIHRPSFRLPEAVAHLKPAGLVHRGIATVLDYLVFLPLFILELAVPVLWGDPFAWLAVVLVTLVKPLFLAYHVGTHVRYGRSLGKMAVGLQVFRRDGAPAGPVRLLGRCLASQGPLALCLVYVDTLGLVSVFPFLGQNRSTLLAIAGLGLAFTYVNALLVALGREHRGLHDRLAGTVVVHRNLRREVRLQETSLRGDADPGLALALSLVPGAAHLYLRAYRPAALLLGFYLIVIPVGHMAARHLSAPVSVVWVLFAAEALVWVASVVHALRLALRLAREGRALAPCGPRAAVRE
ncbi:MAG: protein kinase [Planctomycetes bacterium]|nr:protein kinase [Planctomycetota bacterium]